MIDRNTAQHYTWGDACDGWHLLANPTLSVIEECMPPGTSEVRHLHNRAEQFFYVLAGSLTIEVDGQTSTLSAHQGLHVPAGRPHQVCNLSDTPVDFLVVSTPRSHGDRVPA
ncbi:MAG: cupin domain-containing protein [Bryobacteraceae bacterium]